jgi:hypothetical protein
VKKPRRRRKKANQGAENAWMSILALMAAEARVDGGAGLHSLLQSKKFDERPHLSLTKRKAA